MVGPELQARRAAKQCIAEVEATPIVNMFLKLPKRVQHRDVLWWEDNTVTLSTMIKGGSSSKDCDRAAAVVHLCSAFLRSRVWWEYIESKSVWSDGASRLLGLDPFAKSHGLPLVGVDTPMWPWVCGADELVEQLKSTLRAALGGD